MEAEFSTPVLPLQSPTLLHNVSAPSVFKHDRGREWENWSSIHMGSGTPAQGWRCAPAPGRSYSPQVTAALDLQEPGPGPVKRHVLAFIRKSWQILSV